MGTKALADYFSKTGMTKALTAYSAFALRSEWSVAHKMDLYTASRKAFAEDGDWMDFVDVYMALLKYWQVFRPHSPKQCWDIEKIYKTLKSELAEYRPDGGMDLTSFAGSSKHHHLSLSLQAFESMKPNNGFPAMTVSKFAHFYNPSLFPIYDTAIIWNRVWKAFGNDYAVHCDHHALNKRADGAAFLANYVSWAASLISPSSAAIMERFTDWLKDELPPKSFKELSQEHLFRLYATAFEFVAIGAAVAEGY